MAASEPAGDTPDALVIWQESERAFQTICSHCTSVKVHHDRGEGHAWRWLTDHLVHVHGLRRVWIDRFDHSTAPIVQLAMPIVLEGKARAERRARSDSRRYRDHA